MFAIYAVTLIFIDKQKTKNYGWKCKQSNIDRQFGS